MKWDGPLVSLTTVADFAQVLGPDAKEPGTLTPPREFNLMFKTIVGAMGGEEDAAFLRPETAQGIFVNFKNVVDSSRVRIPFGIGQIGKSFRNEITPRNFTFRSREFEQMEIEFFCHPSQSALWYRYWRDRRFRWYTDMGISRRASLRLREHEKTRAAEPTTRPARPTSSTPSRSCRRASTASWKGSPTAATSTCAATWRASSSTATASSKWSRGPDG